MACAMSSRSRRVRPVAAPGWDSWRARHARHDHIAPAEDIVARVSQIGEWNRRLRPLVEQLAEEALGRKLPVIMGHAAQDPGSRYAGDKQILAEVAAASRLGMELARKADALKRSLELPTVEHAEALRVQAFSHRLYLAFSIMLAALYEPSGECHARQCAAKCLSAPLLTIIACGLSTVAYMFIRAIVSSSER
jgi:hypothetical protein